MSGLIEMYEMAQDYQFVWSIIMPPSAAIFLLVKNNNYISPCLFCFIENEEMSGRLYHYSRYVL